MNNLNTIFSFSVFSLPSLFAFSLPKTLMCKVPQYLRRLNVSITDAVAVAENVASTDYALRQPDNGKFFECIVVLCTKQQNKQSL